ncbi:MAG TPA: hypothetical protein VG028_02565 [Terriglobia bacterium]|nr:hypothetical protein [Terriglobia bacterium]
MKGEDLVPPKAGPGDYVHSGVKAAVAVIPIVGGPAAELIDFILKPPVAKRLEEWRDTVADSIRELETKFKGMSVESLGQNPLFVSTIMHATQIAIRSHQNEKREALRNAVLNVASGNEADEDLVLMFLNFIDLLTPQHLRLLKLFQSPPVPIASIPAYQKDRIMFDQVVKEIFDRGLIGMPQHLVARGPQDLYRVTTQGPFKFESLGQVTSLGSRFLRFIASPVQ